MHNLFERPIGERPEDGMDAVRHDAPGKLVGIACSAKNCSASATLSAISGSAEMACPSNPVSR